MASDIPAAAAATPASAPAPASRGSADRWPALESNAEVLTDFLARLCKSPTHDDDATNPAAVAAFSFADIFSLGDELLAFMPQPVHALMLAFADDAIAEKTTGKEGSGSSNSGSGSTGSGSDSSLVFIRLLPALDAACGIVALLHALANAPELRAATAPDSLLGRFVAGGAASGNAPTTPEVWGQRLDEDEALRAAPL